MSSQPYGSHAAYRSIKFRRIVDKAKPCTIRSDRSGWWNMFKTWWLFLLHLVLCCPLLFVLLYLVHDRTFHTGSPEAFFTSRSGLCQRQVNAMLSLALVCIRLVEGSCSALLIWRIVFIMLSKGSMSLAEITRLSDWRFPISPTGRSITQIL